MLLPPPNVTGKLHIGHALMLAIQDAMVRNESLSGKNINFIPGMDHAGIGTQSVVENMLWRENEQTRHDLGREEFVNRVWDWKEEYGGNIKDQMNRMGVSLDWTQEYFTMDDARSQAVNEAFVQLYE